LVFYDSENAFNFVFNLFIILGNFSFYTIAHNVIEVNNLFKHESFKLLTINVERT